MQIRSAAECGINPVRTSCRDGNMDRPPNRTARDFVNSRRSAAHQLVEPGLFLVRQRLDRLWRGRAPAQVKRGPGGGAMLARSPSKITVQDIYEALGEPPFIEGHSKDPVANCAVSVCMPRVVERLNDQVTKKASAVLRKTTLQKLLDEEVGG